MEELIKIDEKVIIKRLKKHKKGLGVVVETQDILEGAVVARFEVLKNGLIRAREEAEFYPFHPSIFSLVSGYFPSIIKLSELLNSSRKVNSSLLILSKPVLHYAKVAVYNKNNGEKLFVYIKPLEILSSEKFQELYYQNKRFESYAENFISGFSYRKDGKIITGCFNPYFTYTSKDIEESIVLKLGESEGISIFPVVSEKDRTNVYYYFDTNIEGILLRIYLLNVYSKSYNHWIRQMFKVAWLAPEQKNRVKVNNQLITEFYNLLNLGIMIFDSEGKLYFSNETASKLSLLLDNVELEDLYSLLRSFGYSGSKPLMFSKPLQIKKTLQQDPYSGMNLHVIPILNEELEIINYIGIIYEVNDSSIIPTVDEQDFQPFIVKIINVASQGIVYYDINRNMIYLNKLAQEQLSVSENIIRLPHILLFETDNLKLLIPDTLLPIIQLIYSVISGNDAKEIRIQTQEDKEITIRPVIKKDSNNKVQAVVLLLFSEEDTYLRKENQELFSLKIWEEVLSVIYDPIALFDSNKNLIIANQTFKEIYNSIKNQLKATEYEFVSIFDSLRDKEQKAIWQREIIDGTEYLYEINKIDENYFVVTLINYSELNKVLEETKKASKKLEESNYRLSLQIKLFEETFQDALLFLKATSHDLKAPLRAIGTFSMFVGENFEENNEIRELTNKITELTNKTASALEEIVKISRIFYREEDNIRSIDPIKYLLEVIKTTILKHYITPIKIPQVKSIYWVDSIEKMKSLFWLVIIGSVPYLFEYKWDMNIYLETEENQVILKIFRRDESPKESTPRLSWFTINALRSVSTAIYPLAGYNVHVVNYRNECTIYIQQEELGGIL